jgi:phosphopantetheine adenylyltransferase
MAPIESSRRALLLLPALSLPLSRPSLSTAYKGTFEALILKLKPQLSADTIYRLDVAVALSSSYPSPASTSRTALYSDLQTLLLEVYTLVCLAAVSTKVDLDVPGGVDARVIIIDPVSSKGDEYLAGPLVPLPTFLSAPLPQTIFSTESESGLALEKAFTTTYQSMQRATPLPNITRLPSGPSLTTIIPTSPLLSSTFSSLPSSMQPPPQETTHHILALGGTFDHLHIGHKLLLSAILILASPTPTSPPRDHTIGITGDALLTKKSHPNLLESWSTRQSRCATFLESILAFHPDPTSLRTETSQDEPGPNGKVISVTYTAPAPSGHSQTHPPATNAITIHYTQIQDPYGPTITKEDITALVVSAETRKGGAAVNEKRREKGWKELEVWEVGILDAEPGDGEGEAVREVREGFEGKVSSTDIRRRLAEK